MLYFYFSGFGKSSEVLPCLESGRNSGCRVLRALDAEPSPARENIPEKFKEVGDGGVLEGRV
jgi:hypothetical protein